VRYAKSQIMHFDDMYTPNWKKVIVAYFEILSQHLPEGTVEYHRKHQSKLLGLQAEI
jgi:hypothetical protein